MAPKTEEKPEKSRAMQAFLPIASFATLAVGLLVIYLILFNNLSAMYIMLPFSFTFLIPLLMGMEQAQGPDLILVIHLATMIGGISIFVIASLTFGGRQDESSLRNFLIATHISTLLTGVGIGGLSKGRSKD